jgi:hypothetical protein
MSVWGKALTLRASISTILTLDIQRNDQVLKPLFESKNLL